jgi:hypothetical protein
MNKQIKERYNLKQKDGIVLEIKEGLIKYF